MAPRAHSARCSSPRSPGRADSDLACAIGEVTIQGVTVDAALPFCSFFAGLLVAADLVRASLPGYPQVANFALFDWFGPMNTIHAWDRKPRPDCICRQQRRGFHDQFNAATRYWPVFRLTPEGKHEKGHRRRGAVRVEQRIAGRGVDAIDRCPGGTARRRGQGRRSRRASARAPLTPPSTVTASHVDGVGACSPGSAPLNRERPLAVRSAGSGVAGARHPHAPGAER